MKRLLGFSTTLAVLLTAACEPDIAAPGIEPRGSVTNPPRLTWNVTPTPDSSGQVTEPDVVIGWHGIPFWMTASPFPGSNAGLERPSVWVSADGVSWTVPEGGSNPIVTDSNQASDPDLLIADDSLWLVYRINTSTADTLYGRRSGDGITWGGRVPLNVTGGWAELLSPALLIDTAGTYHLWVVNAAPTGCFQTHSYVQHRTSLDGRSWTQPDSTGIGVAGWVTWHIDVEYFEGSYWAVYAAHLPGEHCYHSAVFLSRSQDGRNWTNYPHAVLGEGGAYEYGVYRSSISLLKPDTVGLWYSGLKEATSWRMASEKLAIVDLLARVE